MQIITSQMKSGIKTSEGVAALAMAAGALVTAIVQIVVMVIAATKGDPLQPELLGGAVSALVIGALTVWAYASGRTKLKISESEALVERERIAAAERATVSRPT